jgi:molybdenum cofactor cytidylyltransferase
LIFGQVPVTEAEGAILAHSMTLKSGVLKKGSVLDQTMVEAAVSEGISEVTVAKLESGELSEDAAAAQIGTALTTDGLKIGRVFTGRVNLVAEKAGVVRVAAEAVSAFNAVDEGLTLSTLSDYMRVSVDQLVATVKVIPYGIASTAVAKGVEALGAGALSLHPFTGGVARLIMTKTDGFKDSLLAKGERIVAERIEALGFDLGETVTVPHQVDAIAQALAEAADLHLILGASATSDRADVAPTAVRRAGGRIERFGMPVDPGNLLFLGELRGAPVVGLPGCARSPALNGVDWVLERLAAGLTVSSADMAAMGVGGLLKEMPGRPQPRRPR